MSLNKQIDRALGAVAMAMLATACLLAPASAQALAGDKTVAAEAVEVVPAFSRWVTTVVVAPPEQPPTTTITTIPWAPPAVPATAVAYEPWPVIVGAPELPLVGAGVAQAGRAWGSTFNYQGMHVRLLVLDTAGSRLESRPLSVPPKAGERFKIRVTSTFDAVAEVSVVQGEAWTSQRAGQFYPAAGTSVQFDAGETVDLPLDRDQYFVMGRSSTERLLLSVRHGKALGDARSAQPTYRQDGGSGSSYLQLVPRGTWPAIEQLLSQAVR